MTTPDVPNTEEKIDTLLILSPVRCWYTGYGWIPRCWSFSTTLSYTTASLCHLKNYFWSSCRTKFCKISELLLYQSMFSSKLVTQNHRNVGLKGALKWSFCPLAVCQYAVHIRYTCIQSHAWSFSDPFVKTSSEGEVCVCFFKKIIPVIQLKYLFLLIL